MAEEAAAPAKAPSKKPPGRRRDRPGVSELIVRAVSTSIERSGMSFPAIRAALAAIDYDVEKNNSRIKMAVRSLVRNGTLVQVTGSGASGSYKINKKAIERAKKRVAKAKKAAAKKSAKTKKSAAVKKSPQKAKKPAAAKKEAKSPNKAAKKPTAAKKDPAKKAAKPKVNEAAPEKK